MHVKWNGVKAETVALQNNCATEWYVNIFEQYCVTKLCTVMLYIVGGIKTVTFPSRAVPSKEKRVPILFSKNRNRMGGEQME